MAQAIIDLIKDILEGLEILSDSWINIIKVFCMDLNRRGYAIEDFSSEAALGEKIQKATAEKIYSNLSNINYTRDEIFEDISADQVYRIANHIKIKAEEIIDGT